MRGWIGEVGVSDGGDEGYGCVRKWSVLEDVEDIVLGMSMLTPRAYFPYFH